MALDKNTLGQMMCDAANDWNDKNIDVADLPAARLNFWTAIADAVITHFETNGVIKVTVATTGTATAQTGTGTGTIS